MQFGELRKFSPENQAAAAHARKEALKKMAKKQAPLSPQDLSNRLSHRDVLIPDPVSTSEGDTHEDTVEEESEAEYEENKREGRSYDIELEPSTEPTPELDLKSPVSTKTGNKKIIGRQFAKMYPGVTITKGKPEPYYPKNSKKVYTGSEIDEPLVTTPAVELPERDEPLYSIEERLGIEHREQMAERAKILKEERSKENKKGDFFIRFPRFADKSRLKAAVEQQLSVGIEDEPLEITAEPSLPTGDEPINPSSEFAQEQLPEDRSIEATTDVTGFDNYDRLKNLFGIYGQPGVELFIESPLWGMIETRLKGQIHNRYRKAIIPAILKYQDDLSKKIKLSKNKPVNFLSKIFKFFGRKQSLSLEEQQLEVLESLMKKINKSQERLNHGLKREAK